MKNLFTSARIKLTLWYLSIVIVICTLYSIAIYSGAQREFNSFEKFQERVQEDREFGLIVTYNGKRPIDIDPNMVAQSKMRFNIALLLINGAVIVLSGFGSYFLAGKTLQPIQDMVVEQSRFISDASHELRTPLTSLRSGMEVGLLDERLDLKEAKALILSNLEDVAELQHLADKLLELSKYETIQQDIIASTILLSDVVGDAVKRIQSAASKKKIRIIQKIESAYIIADRQLMRELFTVILDNAVKYSNIKGTVRITSSKNKKYVLTTITDKGIGINARDLPHIFDRFYRSDSARSGNEKGYGLGLAIAKKIADLHNGSIDVKSNKKEGTTFTIKIPISS